MYRPRKSLKSWLLACVVVLVVVFFVLVNYCSDGWICLDRNKSKIKIGADGKQITDILFPKYVLPDIEDFDLEDEDVLVFLHIQKTGGTTFGRHLVNNLDLEKPCVCTGTSKKCECLTRKKTLWLFSRYSTGWACGLHADWTELKYCVDQEMDKQEKQHRTRRCVAINNNQFIFSCRGNAFHCSA